MSTPPSEPSQEELRAAYEAELKRITVADVVLQTAVSLINLAGRRLGRSPGTEDERDLDQVRDAVDAVRGLLPVLERVAGPDIAPLREALSQLQLAYARDAQGGEPGAEAGGEPAPATGGGAEGGAAPAESEGSQEGPGPAQSSGRLWIPGQ